MPSSPQDEPLFSVVIPTRNRWDTLVGVVDAMLASPEPDFEVVVHDNSDRDGLAALLPDDPRLRFIRTIDPLNMHQNFDHALLEARGHYAICLGDDDALRPELTALVLRDARERGFDAVLSGVDSYYWPGLRHWHWGEVGGSLERAALSALPRQRTIDVAAELRQVMRQGVTGGLGLLPRVYQGFASRRVLDRLRETCGTCFPGASPDMANAVGLAAFVDTMLWDDRSLVISGHSPRSGGGQGAAGKHHGKLEDQPHLPPETVAQWNPAIPRFWSGRTVYAQSACEALRASGHPAPPPLAAPRLLAACLVYEPAEYRLAILAAARQDGRPLIAVGLAVGAAAVKMLAQRARAFIGNYLRYRLRPAQQTRYESMSEVLRAA